MPLPTHAHPQNGVKVPQHIQSFITGATFSTLTNVNFDEARFVHMLQQATDYSAELKQKLAAAGVTPKAVPSPSELGWTGSLPHPMQYTAAADSALLKEQSKEVRCSAVLVGQWQCAVPPPASCACLACLLWRCP
jgi:hydroxylamine reductase (hybrid-cluster protein)